MNHLRHILLTELRSLIKDLGKNGGQMSPAVYDTSQWIRLSPGAKEEKLAALAWLKAQQQADGGWGGPAMPIARDVPTLAAVLALCTYPNGKETSDVIEGGLAFLQQQKDHWGETLPDDIPIGAELTLPKLLDEAEKMGLNLSREPYVALEALGNYRRKRIIGEQPSTGTPTAFSWETFGNNPDPAWVDPIGSVGTSPAATVAWLHAAHKAKNGHDLNLSQDYLTKASDATCFGIPGVVPFAWPVDRFEQAFGLYALLMGGHLHHPALQDVIWPQLYDLARVVIPHGLAYNDYFKMGDLDDTATAIAVLNAAGIGVDLDILKRFQRGDRFFTYPGELQPSLSAPAHAIHALAISGEKVSQFQRFLVGLQHPAGHWERDKWHASWLYTTSHIIVALLDSGYTKVIESARESLLAYQHQDGGWGLNHTSTIAETSHVVLALNALQGHDLLGANGLRALHRGHQWLLYNYRPFLNIDGNRYWIGKELYTPYRIDRAFEMSALLALMIDEVPTPRGPVPTLISNQRVVVG